MRLGLAALTSLALLVGCAPQVALRYAPEGAEITDVERVYFSTTRQADAAVAEPYTYLRDPVPRYGRFDISIPPERELGSLPLPPAHSAVDPRKEFVAVGSEEMSAGDFRRTIAAEFSKQKRGPREAVIFVHGFNNNFASGLYRFAQLSHDLEFEGVQVHYSWPSRGSVLGYAYDRDSVLFARDGLEELMEQLSKAGADRIILVAHSMGSHLTMETLRQIGHKKNRRILNSLAGVVLMSPDIDVTLFRTQATSIGKLPQPFVIMASASDKALTLSALVSRDTKGRLGSVTDIKELAGLDVTLIDTGAFNQGTGHFDAATSPALIRLMSRAGDIDRALSQDTRARIGLLPGAVLSVQGATQIVLSPVLRPGEGLND